MQEITDVITAYREQRKVKALDAYMQAVAFASLNNGKKVEFSDVYEYLLSESDVEDIQQHKLSKFEREFEKFVIKNNNRQEVK